jgi:hypothetical protein
LYGMIEILMLLSLGLSSVWMVLGLVAPHVRARIALVIVQGLASRLLGYRVLTVLLRRLEGRLAPVTGTSCSSGCDSCGSCAKPEPGTHVTPIPQPIKLYCSTKARSIT